MKVVFFFLMSLMFIEVTYAEEEGKTYTTRRNWVVEYTENGGDLKNITGLEMPSNWYLDAQFTDVVHTAGLPARFNWSERTPFGLQPIRNQKNCGSCWAFSVTAVLESLWIIANPGSYFSDLSEQELVSTCSDAGSCSGGYFRAFDYLKEKGLGAEQDFPYTARNSSCKEIGSKAKISNWAYVKSPTTEKIKAAMLEHGPIICDVSVNSNFKGYDSGVYNSCSNTNNTNHMITIEGWNDDDGGYWIMRNSWGSEWGEDGYMRIRYTGTSGGKCNGICGIAAYGDIDYDFTPVD